ncbi:MAG: hypothetical protein KatS3mg108_0429 [Isosphaeraceae bacterium]|jgi:hypothetical protein|nr:MAG: hypothetical protein KatS3mg108_0429 [Isosphaeraceae bacterium]
MHPLTLDDFRSLLSDVEAPCLSLYQPTHRHHPENQQDPIRFRNLVKELEASLRRRYPTREVKPLLEPFLDLADNGLFWKHTLDGLAVFASPGRFRVFTLQRPVNAIAVVADSFHTKPLVRILQSADRFQILGLNRQTVRLYEGNRDALDEIDADDGVPRSLTEALGEELTEPYRGVTPTGVPSIPSVHHGHGSRKDEIDIDTERFFRAVDRAVLERHSKPTGLPLILASLPEYHGHFRALSKNPMLVPEAIPYDPASIDTEKLRAEAWKVIEPSYARRLAELVEKFGAARARGQGSADIAEIARAAVAGRVGHLLVEADRHDPGHIDPTTGVIEPADLEHPEVDDLLDDLAELVLRMGGEVVVVPRERMPVETGAAATYRF